MSVTLLECAHDSTRLLSSGPEIVELGVSVGQRCSTLNFALNRGAPQRAPRLTVVAFWIRKSVGLHNHTDAAMSWANEM